MCADRGETGRLSLLSWKFQVFHNPFQRLLFTNFPIFAMAVAGASPKLGSLQWD